MNADTWDQTDDWPEMLRALPGIDGSRKLRLWCVAWARAVFAVAEGHTPFRSVGGWFTPAAVAGYVREVDAAEAFADGERSRSELHAAKARTGGPHNVFHFPGGLSRLTPNRITGQLLSFVREFRIPTDGQLAALLRDIFGNPFRPVAFDPSWRTDTVVSLARQMYELREFSAMPILADALQDAGCDSADILDHCRDVTTAHVRGCWVVDLVLAKV